jgi:hypothetical protein
MEVVVVLHEMHRKRLSGVILKIDFKKSYDKVNWLFILETLRMKGFSPTWCKWIDYFTRGGHIGINVNDHVGANF